jgi:hypothetical protein
MRGLTSLVAFLATLTLCFGTPAIRQRRAEMVVTGIVGQVSGSNFTLRTQAGVYNVIVTRNTIISVSRLRPQRVIVPGARVTVQGFPQRRAIVAIRIMLLQRPTAIVHKPPRRGG